MPAATAALAAVLGATAALTALPGGLVLLEVSHTRGGARPNATEALSLTRGRWLREEWGAAQRPSAAPPGADGGPAALADALGAALKQREWVCTENVVAWSRHLPGRALPRGLVERLAGARYLGLSVERAAEGGDYWEQRLAAVLPAVPGEREEASGPPPAAPAVVASRYLVGAPPAGLAVELRAGPGAGGGGGAATVTVLEPGAPFFRPRPSTLRVTPPGALRGWSMDAASGALEVEVDAPAPGGPPVLLRVDADRAFLAAHAFPPDVSRGLDVAPALVRPGPGGDPPFYTEPLLVPMPFPDQSMPFNVVAFTSTLLAFVVGSVLNLVARSDEDVRKAAARAVGEKADGGGGDDNKGSSTDDRQEGSEKKVL